MMQTEQLHKIFTNFPRVGTDSRNCTKDSIFFALHGDNFDGNKYAQSALENGARYAVVDDPKAAVDERFILVENSLKALQDLALFHRKMLKTPLIGITGSNGKTTTKELIAAVLQEKYKTLYTLGNFNNHIGVPLTLLRLKPEHEIGIIEMGANHVGEINELCQIADPDYGLITNIGKAHLEGFGSYEGIIKTKTELYRYIQKKEGNIFVNQKDNLLLDVSQGIKRIFYENSQDDITIISNSPTLSVKWKAAGEIKTQLTGSYNLDNIRAALCVGQYFEVPAQDMTTAISEYKPTNNRSQIIKTQSNILVMDAYNANPTSMQLAVSDFSQNNANNKVVILGAMKELGSYSDSEHKKILNLVLDYNFRKALFIGTEFYNVRKEQQNCLFFKSTDELITYLQKSAITNSTILIKGSRSIALEKIIPKL